MVPKMTDAHYDYLSHVFGNVVPWPNSLEGVADELAKTNPRFDRDKFIRRATEQWEKSHVDDSLEDSIPY